MIRTQTSKSLAPVLITAARSSFPLSSSVSDDTFGRPRRWKPTSSSPTWGDNAGGGKGQGLVKVDMLRVRTQWLTCIIQDLPILLLGAFLVFRKFCVILFIHNVVLLQLLVVSIVPIGHGGICIANEWVNTMELFQTSALVLLQKKTGVLTNFSFPGFSQ